MAARIKPRAALPSLPCSFEDCKMGAIARVPGVTGSLVNVCKEHYLFLAEREGDLYCDGEGLKTTEEKRAFCREKMRSFGRISFEQWARSLSQTTINMLIANGDKRCLEKLKSGGFIDGECKKL